MTNFDSIIQQLQQQRSRIDLAINALTSLNGASSNGTSSTTRTGRTMSAAARARIAAAQRQRWARLKGKQGTSVRSSGSTPKRRISAAGIARIRTAAKARWAKIKAGKK
jgi:hypothetical protein